MSALRLGSLLETTEFAVFDQFVRLRASPEPSQVVAIVAIDEQMIEEAGHPIPDDVLATILEHIELAGARAIGLDLYRDRVSGDSSSELYSFLVKSNRTIGAMLFASLNGQGISPPEALRARGLFGAVNAPTDSDSHIRRLLLYVGDATRTVPSFPMRTAMRFLQDDGIEPVFEDESRATVILGSARLARLSDAGGPYGHLDTGGYQIMAPFARELSAYPVLTARSVLDGSADLSVLEDRAVLVGTISESVSDRISMPLRHPDGGTITNGVLLNASYVDGLISLAYGDGRPMRFLSPIGETLLIGGVVLFIGVLLQLAARLWLVLALGLAATIGVFWGGYGLMLASLVLPTGTFALTVVAASVAMIALRQVWERADRNELMSLFRAHVSASVADTVWRQRHALTGRASIPHKELHVTILIVDMAESSRAADQLPNEQFSGWIGAFQRAMTEVALRFDAYIDKYLGDGLMVVFGAPIPSSSEEERSVDARRAVDCALAMADAVRELNRINARSSQPPVKIRIGIHAGQARAGTIGAAGRLEYTVMGSTPTIAARLEALGKVLPDPYGTPTHTRILLSEAVASRLPTMDGLLSHGAKALRGFEDAVWVFEVLEADREGRQ